LIDLRLKIEIRFKVCQKSPHFGGREIIKSAWEGEWAARWWSPIWVERGVWLGNRNYQGSFRPNGYRRVATQRLMRLTADGQAI